VKSARLSQVAAEDPEDSSRFAYRVRRKGSSAGEGNCDLWWLRGQNVVVRGRLVVGREGGRVKSEE
jgi:hypothetical protein